MSTISENLKYLRKRLGLTQEQMSVQLGIKRSLLGAYEEGRADPRISNLVRFAEIFQVSVDELVGQDLTKGSSDDHRGKAPQANELKVLSITVDQKGKENIELVPQKAAAGYLNGYADPEYIEELPRFQLPFLADSATYRAFEITGDSMLPLRSGTIVIGRYLDDMGMIKDGRTYVLVTKDEGVVYKRIYRDQTKENMITLSSDNRQYSSYEVGLKDILEVWESKAFISLDFPDEHSDGMSLERLSQIVLELQQEIIKLKDG